MTAAVSIRVNDPVNARILEVSEDRVVGFLREPLAEIAAQTGLAMSEVGRRIAAMLRAGTIRRVRQTLASTSLARGALVAWLVPPDRINAAFDWMFANDPFTGHVVIRSTDSDIPGARYRLWTTLKVPEGFSLERHCLHLARMTGAEQFKAMPARRLFALGVGHVRRRGMEVGSKSDELARATEVRVVELSDLEWRVLTALKREFSADELQTRGPFWAGRAAEADVDLDTFHRIAEDLDRRGLIGRFSTFLEHVKPLSTGERVTRFNGLFHWAVPRGRQLEAGRQVGRFHILTHAYWREAGSEFGNVNIMAVAHGTEKATLLAHKRAIDEHLASVGIPATYTNVFWGGRSEIKPSEISPIEYRRWAAEQGME